MVEQYANLSNDKTDKAGSGNTVLLYKKLGETPLACLLRYKIDTGETRVMTYAGRLDPLAEGVLLCLIGDECKNKAKYLSLNKKYTFEILVGFSTDTHDLLGLTEVTPLENLGEIDSKLLHSLQSFVGKHHQVYPAYSSKTVNGVQLHTLARANKLGEIDIPSREVEIFELKLCGTRNIFGKELLKDILSKIDLVKGDFRQEQIKEKWKSLLNESISYKICKIEMYCSSGTYVRALIRDLSKKMGIPMCANSIKRTAVGDFVLPQLQ